MPTGLQQFTSGLSELNTINVLSSYREPLSLTQALTFDDNTRYASKCACLS